MALIRSVMGVVYIYLNIYIIYRSTSEYRVACLQDLERHLERFISSSHFVKWCRA